jgi:uncharacterized protein YceK
MRAILVSLLIVFGLQGCVNAFTVIAECESLSFFKRESCYDYHRSATWAYSHHGGVGELSD